MDAGTDNKNSNSNQVEDKEREAIKAKQLSGYPSNNNYPRKLSKREKKNNTATKSIEDQKLVIRKDFIENRHAQLHSQLVIKSEQQTKKEVTRSIETEKIAEKKSEL